MHSLVETGVGTVRGRIDADGVHAFQGIPYGRPPTGAARHRAPQAVAPWAGVFEATTPGAACHQVVHPFLPPGAPMDEDCLHLNVWTPGPDETARRPVMVWLHGGAFHFGSSAAPMTDGARLARAGDVVVVSLNHRLSVFGFLYLKALWGDDYADSGNLGMLDIVLALRWVRDHIARFGGDPDRVTVFGESGGGRKVCVLMGMPAARGLFHRAIVQSGAHPRGVPPDLATRFAHGFLRSIGARTDDPRALHALDGARLLEAAHHYVAHGTDPQLPSGATARWLTMSPVVDGDDLPAHPFDPASPLSRDVPLIIGTTKDEMALFLARTPDAGRLDMDGLHTRLRPMFGPDTARIVDVHRRCRPEESPWDLLVSIASEDRRLLSIEIAERKAAQGGAPVHLYWFTWESDVPLLKAAHTMEIPFVFDTLDATPIVGTRPDRFALAALMSRTWAAFARTGAPDHPALPAWPAFDAHTRATMRFDVPCALVFDPRREERLAWPGPVPMPWEPGAFVGAF